MKKAAKPKKQRIITMTEVIEGTPLGASAPKAPAVESTTATEAAPSEVEDIHLESMVADIDKILLNMARKRLPQPPKRLRPQSPRRRKKWRNTLRKMKLLTFKT